MYAHKTAYTIAIAAACALVVFFALQRGTHNRIILPTPRTLNVETPDQALTIWQQNGVRGRILILFDKYPHMKGLRNYNGSPELTQWNFVEYSVLKNIVRKIYLVVPEEEWEALPQEKEKRPIRPVSGPMRGVYLSTRSGIPLIAVPPSSLGHIAEDVLVYVNTELLDSARATELLKQKTIRSDIMITYRGKH